MAVLINMAMLMEESAEQLFRDAGWDVVRAEPGAPYDFQARRGSDRRLVEIKRGSEGRADRLIPLISQAVLQVRSALEQHPGFRPLAIVGARRIPAAVAQAVLDFSRKYAPEVSVGIIDSDGLVLFDDSSLQQLNRSPHHEARHGKRVAPPNVFSDLNQWLLKVLLARHLPAPDLIHCPQAEFRNASELAAAAQVSVMSAFRLLDQLSRLRFLDEESSHIRLVRVGELLRKWRAAVDRPANELPVRWAIPGEPEKRLRRALNAGGEFCCLGLFAAARDLGYGHVQGAPLHILVHDLDPRVLDPLGVRACEAGEKPDLYIRAPRQRESVFRGVVQRKYKSCDIFQAWLDVSSHPSRGAEQADYIYRKVMEPLLAKAQRED